MPLVLVHKALRRKRKPEWQDTRPPEEELRDAYAIAANHEAAFSRAFLRFTRDLMSPEAIAALKIAVRADNPEQAVNALPVLEASDKMRESFERAYAAIVQEAGQAEINRYRWPIRFEVVEKRVEARFGGRVPINPFSLRWIRERAGELIAGPKGIIERQQANVRLILFRAFAQGLRGPAILRQIEEEVGLLEREQKAVERRFQTTIEAGVPREIAERQRERYAKRLLRKRAARISRTETIDAQAQGRNDAWQLAREEGLMPDQTLREWVAAMPSDRTCPICKQLDGQKVELGEPYDSAVLGTAVQRPPAHPQCLPGDALVSAVGVAATSERRYDGDLIVITTAAGHQLACTPNHPVLGEGGWIPASGLNVGCHVVRQVRGQRVPALVDPDHQDGPSPIHEVAESFRRSREVAAAEVPTSAEDFHGDGKGSEIAIVRTDRLLGDRVDAAAEQHVGKDAFDRVGVRQSLLSPLRALAFLGERLGAAAGGFVCRRCSLLALRCSHPRQANPIGLALAARDHSRFKQPGSDTRAGDAEGFGERILALTGKVALDQVVNVDVCSFHGPILNLETSSGAYVANGIVTHNCRCTEILVFPGQEARVPEERPEKVPKPAKPSEAKPKRRVPIPAQPGPGRPTKSPGDVLRDGMSVAEAEDAIRGQPVEHAGVFDSSGTLLHSAKGSKGSVKLSEQMVKTMRSRGDVVFTHNHPGRGSPLSPADVRVAVEHNMQEMRAVAPDGGGWRVKRPKEGWQKTNPAKLQKALDKAIERAHARVLKDTRADRSLLEGAPDAKQRYKELVNEAIEAEYDKTFRSMGLDMKMERI